MEMKEKLNKYKLPIIIVGIALLILLIVIVIIATRPKEYKNYYWCKNDKPGVYIEYTNTYAKLVGDSKYLTLKDIPQSVWDKYKDLEIDADSSKDRDPLYIGLINEIPNNFIEYSEGCEPSEMAASTKGPVKDRYNTGIVVIISQIRFYN